VLQSRGYDTAYIGKWHMGEDNDEPRPGFNWFVTHKGQGKYFDTEFNINGRERQVVKGYYTTVVTDMAEEWLQRDRGGKPWCLMVGHKAPHSFYYPEPKYEHVFDNVRIPNHYVFVVPELYPMVGDYILATANGGTAMPFVGLARAAFEEAMTYCKQRVQGGKLLCEHQLVQRKLFDMFIKVESARQLSRAVVGYNSVALPPVSRYGVAAKVYCTQTSFEVASDAVQLFGGYGLSKEFLVEKLFRDARASMIEDGANDVLALAGSRSLIDSFI